MKKILLYIIFAWLVSGCAAQKVYDGKLEKNNVAIISPESNFLSFRSSVVILSVDGISLNQLSSGSFEVLPGKHNVKVGIFRMYMPPAYVTNLEFSVNPSQEYIIDYKDADDGRVSYVITEKSTGNLIHAEIKRR